MPIIIGGFAVVLCSISCCCACTVWARAFSLGRRRRKPRKPEAPVCLLVGDSLTQGTISFDWADELSRRLPGLHFANTGVNGDPSFHILERLPGILQWSECARLKAAVVLCGTNDTVAMLHPKLANSLYRGKLGSSEGHSDGCSVDIFEANLRATVRLLLGKGALVVIVSPPPLGEVLPPAPAPSHPSFGPLTALPNALLAQLAAAAHRVSSEEGCAYAPLHEELIGRLSTALAAAGRPPCEFNAGMGQLTLAAWSVLKHQLLGRSWDALSTCEHTHDAIHLNEAGGAILLELLTPILAPLAAPPSAEASLGAPLLGPSG